MGRIRKPLIMVLFAAGLLGLAACNNNLTTALQDKIAKEKSEIPIPGGDGVLATTAGMENITVSWTKGSDNKTAESDLEYMVVYSESDNISTLAGAEANGTAAGAWTKDIATFDVTGLLDNYPYWVNVIIKDTEGNKAVYSGKADTTEKHPRIYWTDSGSDKIRRADLDGSNPEDIITTGLTAAMGISIDPVDRKIYWIENGTSPSKVMRSDFDGSNSNIEELITTGLSDSYGIVVDYENRYLFWTDFGNNKIYRSSLPPETNDAADHVLLDSSDGVDGPYGIDVDIDSGRILWTQWSAAAGKMMTALVDGTGVNILNTFTASYVPYDVGAHDTMNLMFWVDQGTTPMVRSSDYSLAPTPNDLITSNLSTPVSISIDTDNNIMYWIDQTVPQRIYMAPTNPASTDADTYDMAIGNLLAPRGIDVY